MAAFPPVEDIRVKTYRDGRSRSSRGGGRDGTKGEEYRQARQEESNYEHRQPSNTTSNRSLDKIEALRTVYDDPFKRCACVQPEVLDGMETLFIGQEERTTTYHGLDGLDDDLTLDDMTKGTCQETYNPEIGASSEDDILGECTLATVATTAVGGGCGLPTALPSLEPLKGILRNGTAARTASSRKGGMAQSSSSSRFTRPASKTTQRSGMSSMKNLEGSIIGPQSTNSLISEGGTKGSASGVTNNGNGKGKRSRGTSSKRGGEYDDMTMNSTMVTDKDELILDACGWMAAL